MNRKIIYIMGVSGSGKTTVGRLLSCKTGIPFFDADDYHPQANIEKISAGVPLNDEDRLGWLETINQLAVEQQQIKGAIIACSALKQQYRNLLEQSLNDPLWYHLEGSYELIYGRMLQRKDHFMPAALLQSQFDTLETPLNAFKVQIDTTAEAITNTMLHHMNITSSFGIIGLGVMGKSLARNFASKGISLSLYNRFVKDKEENVAANFIAAHEELITARGFEDLSSFVQSLEKPAKILLMIQAGEATDTLLSELQPLLAGSDIIIDGGNTHYKDTERRIQLLAKKNIHLLGTGISGGEEGALNGPAIMPGGTKEAYEQVKTFLETIAAKDQQRKPCCAYTGLGGSGHFVKMVHNGIEYAEMQLLAELYYIMCNGLQQTPGNIAAVFAKWNKGPLSSYLLEITIDILQTKENNGWLIDKIADHASAKGTGSWAAQSAAELGVSAGMMTTSLFARYLSAKQDIRKKTVGLFADNTNRNPDITIDELMQAYELARIINHHQGFQLIEAASEKYQWNINLVQTAGIWTNGCIIRSALMEKLATVLQQTNDFLFHDSIAAQVVLQRKSLAKIVSAAITNSMALPAFCEALNYINMLGEENLPMNLIQAQRDYFGAHTYQRKDDKTGKAVHTEWKKMK
jgi:6-phosphogluconate dehydrogenase